MEDSNAPIDNQSDSDSSESWTFVDKSLPKIETQNQEVSSTPSGISFERTMKEPDEDTDGVAVITDDEEVNSTEVPAVSGPPPVYQSNPCISLPPPYKKSLDVETSSSPTFQDHEEELPTDFFMANRKIKSYVHKRNNHISSLLNLILVGAVIIATTLAIGFTWGISDTCSLDVLDSVNGILANLQKLQRENEMLKSKIRILRSMKYNKPVENDINFDKYLEYQMQQEQQKILPKFGNDRLKDLNVISTLQMEIDSETPHVIKDAIEIEVSNLQINNTNPYIKQETIYKDSEWNTNNQFKRQNNIDINNIDVKKETLGGKRERREATQQPTKPGDLKSYCKNAASQSDKEYKKKCSYFLKQKDGKQNEKVKVKSDDFKNVEDVYVKDDKAQGYKLKKSSEKLVKDKQKSKEMKRDKRYKNSEGFNEYNVGGNQENHNHFNDNIKVDWYQKMYDGRKQIRDNGFDDYDLLSAQNKAKWYFKRMSDREKNRWKSADKMYRRQMRKEYKF